MTRRLLVALALVVAALGLGLWVQERVFVPTPERAAEAPVAIAAQPSATAAPEPEVRTVYAHVVDVSGVVEVYRQDVGRWLPLELESELSDDAVLRTGDGRTTLAIGDGVQVTVSGGSQFRLRELTNRLAKVRLEQGLVTGNVQSEGGGELVVQVSGSDAEARTKDGEFAVLRSPEGQVTVAGKRGNVAVSAAGSAVTVANGEQSVVQPGAGPSQPVKIPGALFIKLTRGQTRKLRYRSTLVEGITTPGAVVEVNGVQAPTTHGNFSVNVPLKEGANSIRVVSRDALGRLADHVVQGIDVDSSPPEAKGSVKW